MKFKILALVIVSIISLEAKSCMVASQYRLFPIGVYKSGLICVELDQHRRSKGGDFKDLIWNVRPRLIRLSHSNEITEIKSYPQVVVEEKKYLPLLRKLMKRSNSDLKKTKHLEVPLDIKHFGFADFKWEFKNITYTPDSMGRSGLIQIDKDEFEIRYPAPYLDHGVNLGLFYDDTVTITDKMVKEDNKYHGFRYSMGTVRHYETPTRDYVLVSLALGDHQFGYLNALSAEDMEVKELSQVLFAEPILHHGHSFDFVVSRKKRQKEVEK